MQTTVESTAKHTVRLTVEVPEDEFRKDLDRAYRSIANQVKIPGFRKGKVPKRIIDAQIGRDVVIEQFLEDSIPLYYRQALQEHDLAPIADPELDVDLERVLDGAPLTFTATVEVRPRLELSEDDYKELRVDRPAAVVSEEDIDEWIDRLRERFAELEPVQRPVQDGDFVTVDLRATVHGEGVPEATRSDYLYLVGSGEFGEKLDAELAGKRAGDILKLNERLPERFGENLAGTEVTLSVLVKDVKARRLPEADDDFAKTASEFDTLAELRDDLRERLHEVKEGEIRAVVRDRVLQAMIERVDVDIPDSLIEEETEHRIAHAKERAERAGVSLEEVLASEGWDHDRLRRDSREHALRAIKSDLVLEGVARAAKLQVDADEIGAEISALAQAYGRDTKELAKQLDRSGQIVTLAGDIIRSKALDLLVEHADMGTETIEPHERSTEAPEADADLPSAPDQPSEENA